LTPNGRSRRLDLVNRTRVRRRRVGAALLGIGIVAAFAGTAASDSGSPEGERLVASHRYVVKAGDTLWAIAEHQARGDDPRPLVDAIADTNDLGSANIVPGQTLIVPVTG
jgi:nucleoid-associated protein YgaU